MRMLCGAIIILTEAVGLAGGAIAEQLLLNGVSAWLKPTAMLVWSWQS